MMTAIARKWALLGLALAAHAVPAATRTPAQAADLREPLPAYGAGHEIPPRPRFGEIWEEEFGVTVRGRSRPARRVTGGPGYVGSEYGLGKPAYSGVGPRPDWGRSSTD